jgi:hypothetical protein
MKESRKRKLPQIATFLDMKKRPGQNDFGRFFVSSNPPGCASSRGVAGVV